MAKKIRRAARKGAKVAAKTGMSALALYKQDEIKHYMRVGMKLARLTLSEGEREVKKALALGRVETARHKTLARSILDEAKAEEVKLRKMLAAELAKAKKR